MSARIATRVYLLFTWVCIAASIQASGQTDRDANVIVTLKSLERLKFEALEHRDTASLEAILDATAMLVEHDGTLKNKADYLTDLRIHDLAPQQIIPQWTTVRVFGGTAIVVGIYDEKGIEKHRPYHRRCRFIDTWAFKKGTWVCIAATATSTLS